MEQLRGTMEYAKLSIENFNAEVMLTPELIDKVLYLIGEVERLKQSNSNLLKQYHERGKDNDKVIYDLISTNTELQKALEEIAEYDVSEKHGYRDEWNEAASFNECQDIAKQALKGDETK